MQFQTVNLEAGWAFYGGVGAMLRAVLLKILFLIGLAFFLPRVLLLYAPPQQVELNDRLKTGQVSSVEPGLTSLPDYLKVQSQPIKLSNLLLVTNQLTELNQEQYLGYLQHYGLCPSLIYQAESHVLAKLPDMLYGKVQLLPESLILKLDRASIKSADIVVIDLQNSGFAPDPTIELLLQILQLGVVLHKQIMLLDRPNPLGYLYEGPLVNLRYDQIRLQLPWRYGLSLGELASYFNAVYFNNQASLTILPVKSYLRNQRVLSFEQLQLIYTGTIFGLLNQICPVDVKRDCQDDFQCFSLPEYLNFPINKWYELRSALRKYDIDVALCRYFNRRTQQYFEGMRLVIQDINRVTYLGLWQAIVEQMQQAQINLHTSEQVNRLFGKVVGKQLTFGKLTAATSQKLNQDLRHYFNRIKPYLIYHPWPVPVWH